MKEIFLKLLSPCCGLNFVSFKRWINALKLNDESKRQDILHELGTNGKLSDEGWQILIGAVELNDTLNLELIQEWQGECNFPTCVHMTLLVSGVEYKVESFAMDANWDSYFYDANGYEIPVTDAESFKRALSNSYVENQTGLTPIKWKDIYIEDFQINDDRIQCKLYANVNYGSVVFFRTSFNGNKSGGLVNVGTVICFEESENWNGIKDFLIEQKRTLTNLYITKSISENTFDIDLPYLKVLDLSSNELESVLFTSAERLTDLILYENNIELFYQSVDMSNLQVLNLGENPIYDIDIDSPKGLNGLKELILSNHAMPDFSPTSAMPNLESLTIVGNALNSFNPAMNLSKLKILNLSSINLTVFNPSQSFDKLINLQLICKISSFDMEFKNLDFLKISSDQIVYFTPQKEIPNLTRIQLTDCTSLELFNPNFNLSKVQELFLDNSNLQSFNPDKPFKDLKYLGLTNNNIQNYNQTDWTDNLKPYGTVSYVNSENSVLNTPVYNALIAKNWTVIV